MERVGGTSQSVSAHFASQPQVLPGDTTADGRAAAHQRLVPPGYPSPDARPGQRANVSFRIAPDAQAADDSFESLVKELVTLDLANEDRRPAPEGALDSLLRRLIALGFDNDDLREIIGARPNGARATLEQLDASIPTLAPLFTPSQLVRIAKAGGASGMVATQMHSDALVELGHSTADMVAVMEKFRNAPGDGLGNLLMCTVDLKPCNYKASTLVAIAMTRGFHILKTLARLGPELQSAGYAPDKLAEIVQTGGKRWQVLEALFALDALRRDKVCLLDCFEPNSLAEIAIKSGPDTLNALRGLWKDLAHPDPATGKYVPSFLSAKEIYDLACVRDGGEGLRNAARAHGVDRLRA